VGGASQLPTVGRMLKEKFGRRVYKSPYAHASIAVGLAIAAESTDELRLQNRFTRYFGVWREADGGRAAWFDPVIPQDMLLPFPQPDATDPQSEISWSLRQGRLAQPLSRAAEGAYWVPLRDLPDNAASSAWRALPYTLDWPGWVATPVQFLKLPFRAPLETMFDVVVYIPEMTPSRPV
jgi:hypothetical protein